MGIFLGLLFCALVLGSARAWNEGAPCSAQHTLTPSLREYGEAAGTEPPYQLTIAKSNGDQTHDYVPGEVYTGTTATFLHVRLAQVLVLDHVLLLQCVLLARPIFARSWCKAVWRRAMDSSLAICERAVS